MIINGTEITHNANISETEYKKRLEQITANDVGVFEELRTIKLENIQSDAYAVILCTQGNAIFKIEGKEYQMEKNDLICAHPKLIFNAATMSDDFMGCGMWMSPTYFENIFMLGGNAWETMLAMHEHPLIHLNDKQAENFIIDLKYVSRKFTTTDLPHHSETIKLLLQALTYEFYDNISPMTSHQRKVRSYSSADAIFKNFLSMISAESPCRHDVAYYADKLCITPKYLSSICKKQTGATASVLINHMTVNYIKQMLLNSDKSIKQICTEAGFDNLSFFGKYVRRELGMSPREFRQKGE